MAQVVHVHSINAFEIAERSLVCTRISETLEQGSLWRSLFHHIEIGTFKIFLIKIFIT